MHCYTASKGIETSCLAQVRSNRELLRLLELEITSLENSQVRLNAYGTMELINNSLKIQALNDRISAIDWSEAEINFNESQYDV
jgi:hypothetical protein